MRNLMAVTSITILLIALQVNCGGIKSEQKSTESANQSKITTFCSLMTCETGTPNGFMSDTYWVRQGGGNSVQSFIALCPERKITSVPASCRTPTPVPEKCREGKLANIELRWTKNVDSDGPMTGMKKIASLVTGEACVEAMALCELQQKVLLKKEVVISPNGETAPLYNANYTSCSAQ